MFTNLFGKKKDKIDPAKQKELSSKKNDLEIKLAAQQFDDKITANEQKMAVLETQIREKTKVS